MAEDALPTGTVTVVGLPVARVSMAELVETFMSWTESSGVKVAVGVNAHVCNAAAADGSFRQRILEADLAYADGQVIVWAAKALGSPIPERIATTDLVYPLAIACALRGKKLYLFGSGPGVAELAGEQLAEHAPGLQFRAHDGYLSPTEIPGLLAEISEYSPDVLLVGLGDPLQQNWIAEHRDVLSVPAILTCGGLFDWTSGKNRRAPSWMITAGLEWLWRLIIEPRRLAKRYLLGNPAFVARLSAQLLHSKLRGRKS